MSARTTLPESGQDGRVFARTNLDGWIRQCGEPFTLDPIRAAYGHSARAGGDPGKRSVVPV